MKIAVIHATMIAVEPLENGIKEIYPTAQVFNFVNDSLLKNSNSVGWISTEDKVNFFKTVLSAVDSGADGIIVACSIYCPLVSRIREFVKVPIVAIDQPMILKAVDLGKPIGIVATTELSGPTTEKQIKALDASIHTEVILAPEGMVALKSGDRTRHDEIIKNACLELSQKGFETIVLSQLSMASAEKKLRSYDFTVLTSINEGVRAVINAIENRKDALDV